MPMIEVVGKGSINVDEGTKLVLALEDNGVDILHRCGGNARCTTCRVEVLEGDPGPMGEAEAQRLQDKGMLDENVRLSCQVRVHSNLKIRPVMTVLESGMDAGPRPLD